MSEGFSYCIRHGYEYDDGDMRTTRRAMLLFHKIFKNRNNYLLTGVTHEGISTDTTSSMGEHQPFQTWFCFIFLCGNTDLI